MSQTIVFITPKQPHAETIMRNRWTVKLVARRSSDGLVSKTKFNFDYVPHDFYSPCVFCTINPDKQDMGHATIVPPRDVARPGLRKRQMSETELRDFSEKTDLIIEGSDKSLQKRQRQDYLPDASISSMPTTADYKSSVFQPALISSNQILKILPYTMPSSTNLPNPVTLTPNGSVSLEPKVGDFVTYKDSANRLRFGIIEKVGLGSNKCVVVMRAVKHGKPVEQETHCRTLRLVYRSSDSDSPVNA